MLANNKISNSLILEKITEQQENQNKQLVPKIELKLDVYLRGDNNEQISGPEDMYIDDEYEDNIDRILCDKPLTVNHSVTGKLILEKNKELEGLDIETLRVNKFYDANISMNESKRVGKDKKIIDTIIQKLPSSGNYYVEHNKAENSFIVRRGKKETTNKDDYSVLLFVSPEGTR